MEFIDLFSGAGGFSSGIIKSGNKVNLAIDNWGAACDTYSKNFENPIIMQDLSDVENIISLIDDYRFDFIVGGPPCQDFSPAGHGVEGVRADLTVKFAEIASRSQALGFIMENVPQVTQSAAYKKAISIFREKKFGLTQITVDANYFNVPQRRKRFFLIGHKNFPDDYFNDFLEHQRPIPMTVHEGYRDIPVENYYRHPRSYKRRAVFSIYEPSPTIRGVNRPRPKNYQWHPGDISKENNIRSLTYKERAIIQSFDKSYLWVGSETNINQMVGNAVPPELSRNIIDFITKKINQEENKTFSKYLKSIDINLEISKVSSILKKINSQEFLYRHRGIDSYIEENSISSTSKDLLEAYYEFYK